MKYTPPSGGSGVDGYTPDTIAKRDLSAALRASAFLAGADEEALAFVTSLIKGGLRYSRLDSDETTDYFTVESQDPPVGGPFQDKKVLLPFPSEAADQIVAYRDWVSSAIATAISAISGGGVLLKVTTAVKTDVSSVTGTAYGSLFSVSFTPLSATSLIVPIFFANFGVSSASYGYSTRVTKGGTAMNTIGDAAGTRRQCYASVPAVTAQNTEITLIASETAGSTSARTYAIEGTTNNAAGTIYLNRTGTDTDSTTYGRHASFALILEIKQ